MRKGWFLIGIVIFIGLTFPSSGQQQQSLPELAAADWLVLGPFASPESNDDFNSNGGFDRDNLMESGGETEARPKKGLRTAGQEWSSYRANQGEIDLGKIFPGRDNCFAYGYLEFFSAVKQRCVLKMGSDDGIKVWCNGRLIWSNRKQRALLADEDAVPLELQVGVNRLLVKIEQLSGGWGFTMRLGTVEAEAQQWTKVQHPGLRVQLAKPVFATGDSIRCIACTVPNLGVEIPVEMVVLSGAGKELCRRIAKVGEYLDLPLPQDYQGLFIVKASSTDRRLESEPEVGIIGDARQALADTLIRARKIAAQLKPMSDSSLDPQATLAFLADQLEGKLQYGLSDGTYQSRALKAISDLCLYLEQNSWQAAKLTGIRQWAYRSKVDGSLQPFTVYLPPGYDPAQKYSLIVTLHGYTESDYNAALSLAEQKQQDFIVMAPYGRGDMGYRSIGEQDVLDVLDIGLHTYSIDPDRVFLTGSSMGGLGVWRIGSFYADRFAAIAPFCGWTSPKYLGNLHNTPVLIVHGDQDDTVPIISERAAAVELRKMKCAVNYVELPGVGHNAWRGLVNQKGGNYLFDYFRPLRRNRWPNQVVLTTEYLRYGKQYWVQLEELIPGKVGTIKARVVKGKIVVKTDGVTAFSLDLRHPALVNQKTVTVVIDQTTVTVSNRNQHSFFVRRNQKWQSTIDDRKPELVRRLGGGLADLFMDPVVLVYGTAVPERTALLKQFAAKLAAWEPTAALPLGSKLGKFRIVADVEVTPEELTGKNILLFGTPAENQILAQWHQKLPVRFTGSGHFEFAGAKFTRAGIVLTCPNPEAPGKLLGVLAMPFSELAVEQILQNINYGLRVYQVNSSAVEPVYLPDVLVCPSPISEYRAWSFDRYWLHPKEIRF